MKACTLIPLSSLRRDTSLRNLTLAILLPGMLFNTGPVMANPTGGVVVHGDVSFQDSAGQLLINQSSNQAIINWADFSIAPGELTRFMQPGSNAAVLNRVTGGDPSAILGALQANGNVFVINPNGILVGAGGTIDVHGLVLSTLDIENGEFLGGGDLVFKGSGNNGVTNLGRINAIGGDVFLIGKTVTNSGSISATNGTVGLAAGEEVLLKANTGAIGERVFVRATGSGGSGTGITNDGTIEGAAVELKAHGNLYALAINNKGAVRAVGATNSGGRVFLNGIGGAVSNSGSIRASSPGGGNSAQILIQAAYAKVDGELRANGGSVRVQTTDLAEIGGTINTSNAAGDGGRITIEGNEVAIGSTALIDASGSENGGLIQIGGGLQGRDADLLNATLTTAEAGSVLIADSTDGGRGGSVIVWSDGDTLFSGDISAKGFGGGGFAEISGRENLSIDGSNIDLGEGGFLLLDPSNFTVTDAVRTAIRPTLNGGSDVVIFTNGTDSVAGNGDIIFSSDFSGLNAIGNTTNSPTGSLTLLAYGDIFMRRDLVNNGTGNVNLVAGWDGMTPSSFGPSASGQNLTGTPTILMDSQIFANTSTYGNRNGTVYVGLETDKVTPSNVSTITIGSRDGETNVAGYDLVMLGDNTATGTGDNRWVQLGYRPGDVDVSFGRQAATGRIKVNVLNDVIMTAGVRTNPTGSPSATPGQYNFVQIGHGGRDAADNGFNHSGDITVQAGLGNAPAITGNIIGTAGANLANFVHIGHGGHGGGTASGSFSGAITVEAGSQGKVEMTAGTGRRAFTQIGHGGYDVDGGTAVGSVGYHSGAITVRAGTDIVFSAGTGQTQFVTDGYSYSMIGHGGGLSEARSTVQGHNGTITVEAGSGNVSGAIRFKAGDIDDNFVQLGHGGRGSSSGTGADGHWGDIIVDAIDEITFTAGTGQAFRTTSDGRMYAQLGHGGYDSGSNLNVVQTPGSGLGHHGLIQVISQRGDISFLGGDTALGSAGEGFGRIHYAQLGHGGFSTEGDHYGSITVTATAGSIRFKAGATSDDATDGIRNSAQLGHGGYAARGDQGRASDIIAVTAGQDIEFLAGGGTQTSGTLRSYAQLGNGGYDADNPNAIVTGDPGNQGDLRVVSTGGNITFTGGPGGDGYSIIGHGGLNTNGNNSGSISVSALGGAITFTGGSSNDTYAQIGHGGRVARGDHSGSIEVAALGNITFTSGDAARAYAMIGHGGHDSDNPNPTYYPDNDPLTLGRGPTDAERVGNSGSIAVTSSGGDVKFTTGSGGESFVQIGHGGAFTDGDNVGTINVSAVNVIFDASNPVGTNHYAQLGHGGYLASGGHTGAITVNATGEIAFTSGTNGSYTQIGHGGYNDHRITRTGASPNFTQANNNDRFYPGTHSGAIIVNAGSDIRFLGGAGTGSFGQIGHGGFRNAAEAGEGHSGDISVVGGGAIAFTAQNGAQAYVQIGHGGYESFGNHGYEVVRSEAGSIAATQGDSAFLANGALAPGSIRIIVDPANAGAGTAVFSDDGKGNLIDAALAVVGTVDYKTGEVTFTSNVNSTSDPVEVAYLHGGSNILVDGGSGVLFSAGTGANTNAQIGHGGASSSFATNLNIQPEEPSPASYTATTTYHLNTPTGTPVGTSGNITVHSGTGATTNANAAVSFAAGAGNDAFAQLGNGGRAARGDHRGEVNVSASGDISFAAFNGGVDTSTTSNNGTINTRLQNHTSGTFTLAQTGSLERSTLVITYENPIAPYSGVIRSDEFGRLYDNGIEVGSVTTAGVVTLTATVSNSMDGPANSVVAFDHYNLGLRSYAQLGHGGHDADNPNATTPGDPGNLGNISLTSTDGAISFTAGSRNEAYTQLGHGGYVTNGDHSGNIIVEALGANGAITFSGGTRNETYAQLGHGGRSAKGNFGLVDVDNDMLADGDITARTTGSIQFTSGIAAQAYAQLGHGGYDADTVTTAVNPSNRGNILVESNTGDILFSAAGSGGANSNAQLGHGGIITNGDFSGTIAVRALAGSVTFTGGEANERYAQLGHGGRSAKGDHSGDIEVLGATGVTFTGGGVSVVTGEKSLALNDAAVLGAANTAALINLANLELSSVVITVADPLDPAYATLTSNAAGQLLDGNGIQVGTVSALGIVTFDTAVSNPGAGSISVTYNHANYSRAYAQLGNGGWDADQPVVAGQTGQKGDIEVASTGGSITFTAGLGDANYAQLGNGGLGTSGDHSGNIVARAGGDVIFSAATAATTATGTLASRVNNYAQLGHGGNSALGNQSDNISVSAGLGGTFTDVGSAPLVFTPQLTGSVLFTGGTSTDNYAQLGHGGRVARGYNSGVIEVAARDDIAFRAGSGTRSYVQIGHGGHDADVNGNPDSLGNTGNIRVSSTEGNIVLAAALGAATDAYAQIGHGGLAMEGNHSGSITVRAANQISGLAESGGTGVNSYAQIGHGGINAVGNLSGSIIVSAGTTGSFNDVVDRDGSGLIGEAGDAVTFNNLDAGVPIGGIDFRAGAGNDRYAQIGHGGRQSVAATGSRSGEIEVTALDDILFQARTSTRTYAQLGHGGAGIFGTNEDDITVKSTAGSINFQWGAANTAPGAESYVQLGHGGGRSTGSNTGDIVALAENNILFRNATGGTASTTFAQLGHGGYNAVGDHVGNITVLANTGTTQFRSGSSTTAGSGTDRYAQLGHGGTGATGNHRGNISLLSQGNILFSNQGGVASDRSYVQLGHGGYNADATTGHSGNIKVGSRIGTATFTGGPLASVESYAQLGHGGFDANGAHNGDIVVRVGNDLLFDAGQGAGLRSYAQLGHGGMKADAANTDYANLSGNITASSHFEGSFDDLGDYFDGSGNFGPDGVDDTVAITLGVGTTGPRFRGSILVGGGSEDQYALLGHGGTYNRGDHGLATDLIEVTSGRAIAFTGSTGLRGYAQLGNGGYDADNDTTIAGNSGNLRVVTTGIPANGSISFSAGAGQESYAQLGHGGFMTAGSHSGSIAALSANALTFTAAAGTLTAGGYVQLGHGGIDAAGDHSGAITALANAGGIAFTGGIGDVLGNTGDRYAQLGHGGRNAFGNLSGDISVLANGNITFTTGVGSVRGYTQLGHGGHNADATTGNSGDIKVASRTGTMTFTGGNGESVEAYTQLGHGGFDANGAHNGDIVVRVGNDLLFDAGQGAGLRSYAQLGHGGMKADALNTDFANLSGNITLSSHFEGSFSDVGDFFDGSGNFGPDGTNDSVAITLGVGTTGPRFRGSLLVGGGSEDQYSLLGHGGTYNRGDHGDSSDLIEVTSGRSVAFTGSTGVRGYAQLGNGGYDADDDTTTAGNRGDIRVITTGIPANGSITFSAGAGQESYAQLGHGGFMTSGDHNGSVAALSANALTFTAAAGTLTSGGYTQLGHGGFEASGNHSGAITALANLGAITFTGGIGDVLGGNGGRYAQIGHGGTSALGNFSGDIAVLANTNVTFTTGVGSIQGYAQIGHGGHNADATTGHSGAIRVGARTGSIAFTAGGGASVEAYTQIGHGGYDAAGAHNGAIVVRAANDLTMQASAGSGSVSGYAQLGHGGAKAVGSTDGVANLSGAITASSRLSGDFSDLGDFFTGVAVDGSQTMADLGSDSLFDTITFAGTTGGNGLRFLAGTSGTAPGGADAYAQLGHGGRLNRGVHSGDLTVDSGSQILFQAGAIGARTYAQLGHGGHDSAVLGSGPGTTGNTGAITVNAGTNLDFRWGATNTTTSSETYLQLGHGGFQSVAASGGDNSGDIVVNAGNILFRGTTAATAGAASTNNYLQLGHGGTAWSGNHSGSITVEATSTEGSLTRSIAFLGSGNGADRYVQLGHGGRLARGNHGLVDGSGNAIETISVTALGDIVLTSGVGARSYALIGNGGHDADLTTSPRGAAANIEVTSQSGSILVTGNTGDSAFAQIGNGGHVTSGSHRGNITVSANQSVEFLASQAGTAANAYVMLGNGGRDAVGNHSGDISATAENGAIAFNGGASNDRFAQLGHGGRGARGDHSGSITVDAETGVAFTAYNAGPVVSSVSNNAILNALLLDANAPNYTINQTANFDQTTISITYANPLPGFSGRIIGIGGGVLVDDTSLVQVGTISNGGVIDLTVTVSDSGAAAPASVVAFEHTNLGVRSYAQLGHGGHDADDAGVTGNSGDISVITQSGNIDFTGGTRNETYAQLGHGGFATSGAHSGNVSVKALGDTSSVNLLAGSRQDSYTQLGHGGRNATGDFGKVGEVISVVANDINVGGGISTRTYAQIGNGGSAANGNHAGDIQIYATNNLAVLGGLSISGGTTGTERYGLIGHGGVAAAAFNPVTSIVTNTTTGTRTGSILAEVGGTTYFNDLTSIGFMGHLGTTIPTDGSRLALITGQLDTSATVGGLSRIVSHALRSGSAEIGVTNGNLIFDGANTIYTSTNHLDLVASGDVTLNASVMNGGSGDINVIGGWNTTTGRVRDIDPLRPAPIAALAIDANALLADPAAYGNGGTVTIGTGAQTESRAIGTAAGTTSVAGQSVRLNGSDTTTGAFAQIGFNEEAFRLGGGADGVSSSGAIRILTSTGGLSLLGGAADGGTARVGHGGQNTSSTTMGGDITLDLGTGSLTAIGGSGSRSLAMVGHGGSISRSQKSGLIDINAAQIFLGGGTGEAASAAIGHGGVGGSGAITGAITINATGDTTISGGSGSSATSRIGFAGDGYDGSVTAAPITLTTGGDLSILGGSGFGSAATLGHGAFNSPDDALSGDIFVLVGNNIEVTAGTEFLSLAQIGHGGGIVDTAISGDLSVTAGNNILLTASNGDEAAYSKIGHGDDFSDRQRTLSAGGSRAGDIEVAAGQDIVMTDAMIGHANNVSPATSAPATTFVSVSRNDLTSPAGGDLIADAASQFSGETEVRFYQPVRANNRIASGAIINGVTYGGTPVDPSVSRAANEFTVFLTGVNPSVPNEHTNIAGSGPSPAPGGFGFYYNSIALRNAVVNPTDPNGGGNNGGNPGPNGPGSGNGDLDDEVRLALDDELVHDHVERRRRVRRAKPFTISYDGFINQYATNGASIFDYSFNEAPGAVESSEMPAPANP